MKEWIFQVTVVVLLGFIGFALYLHAENGRYQFIKTDASAIVLDTRTGEYWVDASMHINPRTHQVDGTSPMVRKQP